MLLPVCLGEQADEGQLETLMKESEQLKKRVEAQGPPRPAPPPLPFSDDNPP